MNEQTNLLQAHLNEDDFTYLKNLIYEKAGILIQQQKINMLESRLLARLKNYNFINYADYVSQLKNNVEFYENELTELINRVTTNKTDFFRENYHFEYLKDTVFPEIEKRALYNENKTINIWSSASSTGEEPYSLAITLLEYFETKPEWKLNILATDIDTNVLETAKKGIYTYQKTFGVNEKQLSKYFNKIGDDLYQVKDNVKKIIEFRQFNLLSKEYNIENVFNVIFCRNVIIYFDKKTQSQIFKNFQPKLMNNGYLFIGHSETLFGVSEDYKFIGKTIYQKIPIL